MSRFCDRALREFIVEAVSGVAVRDVGRPTPCTDTVAQQVWTQWPHRGGNNSSGYESLFPESHALAVNCPVVGSSHAWSQRSSLSQIPARPREIDPAAVLSTKIGKWECSP